MEPYLGIILLQSLKNTEIAESLNVIARKQPRDWVFLLSSIPEEDFDHKVALLQSNMAPTGTWYAHFFRGDEMVVVFHDRAVRVATDPGTSGPALEHGISHGIPAEQLDFTPRTRQDAEAFFGIKRECA